MSGINLGVHEYTKRTYVVPMAIQDMCQRTRSKKIAETSVVTSERKSCHESCRVWQVIQEQGNAKNSVG